MGGRDYFGSLDKPVQVSKYSSNSGSGRVSENDRGWSTSRRSQGSSLDAAVPQPVRMQRICIEKEYDSLISVGFRALHAVREM